MEAIDVTPENITFAVMLTAAGTGIAAAIITGLVTLIGRVFPILLERITGAVLAFALSLALYIVTGIAVGVDSLDEGLVIFVAWLSCASASVGVHQIVAKGALFTEPPKEP